MVMSDDTLKTHEEANKNLTEQTEKAPVIIPTSLKPDFLTWYEFTIMQLASQRDADHEYYTELFSGYLSPEQMGERERDMIERIEVMLDILPESIGGGFITISNHVPYERWQYFKEETEKE
jgi:hypothetical protein